MYFHLCIALFIATLSNVSSLSSIAAKGNLARWSKYTDVNSVQMGGWHKLNTLCEDPKGNLLAMLKENIDNEVVNTQDMVMGEDFDTLISILESMGKGYDSELVDGEWLLVFEKNGKKSRRVQKSIGKMHKFGSTYSNFDVFSRTFENTSSTPRGNGTLKAKLDFTPIGDGFSKIDDKIILRRISCKISGAGFKYWKLPRVPLPFRAKGYLDFIYLDEDIRITRGNKGGIFIHVREGVL